MPAPGRRRAWLSRRFGEITATGWFAVVLGAGSLVAAAAMHWTELYVLGVALLGTLLLALLLVRLPSRARYDVAARPARTSVGGAVQAEVEVTAGLMPLLSPEIRVPVGERVVRLRLPVLGPRRRHREALTITTDRRGVHPVGPVTEVRADPIGLVRLRRPRTGAREVFVRPRTVALDSLSPGVVNDLEGVPSDQLSVSDLAFHALREYVRGDDLRHVHWRSSASADRLLVRQYQETRRASAAVLVDVDSDAYATEEDFELAASVAASVIIRALQDDFDVVVGWGEETVGSDAGHPDPLLDATCRLERRPAADGARDLRRHAARLAGVAAAAGVVVLISGGRRESRLLPAAAQAFGSGPMRLTVQVDAAARSAVHELGGMRMLTLSRLEHLPALMPRGREMSRHPVGWALGNAAFVVVLTLLALFTFDRSFADRTYLVVGAIGMAVPLSLAVLLHLSGMLVGRFTLLVYAIFLPLAALCVFGGPSLAALLEVMRATVEAPQILLTTIPPANAEGRCWCCPSRWATSAARPAPGSRCAPDARPRRWCRSSWSSCSVCCSAPRTPPRCC